MNIDAPREASSSTHAAPIPLVPPVTTADFPLSVQRERDWTGDIIYETDSFCSVRDSDLALGVHSTVIGLQDN